MSSYEIYMPNQIEAFVKIIKYQIYILLLQKKKNDLYILAFLKY